jgi:hypothetical protein
MLSSEQEYCSLQAQVKFVAEMSKPILHYLDRFESQSPCTLKVFDCLEELQLYFEANCQVSESFDRLNVDLENLNVAQRMENIELFRSAFRNAADKLLKYMTLETDGQPAIKFLKAVRIFDPKNVCLASHCKQDYTSIPGMTDITDEEFNLYVNKLAPQAVAVAGGVWNEIQVDAFWGSVTDTLPNLSHIANKYRYTVCNSADAERSNSLYNILLSDRRRSLSESNLRALMFLYCNKL